MALTLLTDAYDSLANVDSYHAARGATEWAALSDSAKEINIRKATDYIDRNYEFAGEKKTGSQRLKWPRLRAYDPEGNALTDTDAPWQVKEAVAIVADLYRAGTVDLEGIVTDDTAVILEKVDVITVQYDSQSRLRGRAVLSHVTKLLSPVTRGGGSGLLRS